MRTGTMRMLLGAMALLAAVVGGIFLSQEIRRTSADSATAPLMTMAATGSGVTCEGDSPDMKCTVASPTGSFKLAISADSGGGDVTGAATETVFPTGLTYTSKAALDECDLTHGGGTEPGFCPAPVVVDADGGTVVRHGQGTALLSPRPLADQPLGVIVTMPNVACAGAGTHQITLVHESTLRPFGAVLFLEDTTIPIKSLGTKSLDLNSNGSADPVDVEIADTLTINCGEVAGDTPTPTATTGEEVTPTVTETPGGDTPTPTQTATTGPTATPTNTVPATATATATTPGEVLLGDVDCNGTVNSIDALWILWLVAAIQDSVPCPENADVNEDGTVDAQDALWVLWIELNLV